MSTVAPTITAAAAAQTTPGLAQPVTAARLSIAEAQRRFIAGPGYLSACTAGLPTSDTVSEMVRFTEHWAGARLNPTALGADLERCRELFAQIAGVAPAAVGIGSQTSQLVSTIAAGLPEGAEVLCVAGDFSSLTHPFEQQAGRGVRVRYAPIEVLAESVTPGTTLVAFSLVQSATGAIADHEAIAAAAKRAGALTLADLTQSLGWLPVGAASFDFTVCHAYKWLCAPRGTAFLTVRPGLEQLPLPVAAGWCSADDVWSSCYAGHTPLSGTAKRFDVSPAWPVVSGTAAALEFFAALDPEAAHAHAVGLANAARALLADAGRLCNTDDSAIVTWCDGEGRDLAAMQAAGLTASGRAGNARIAFHLWNTERDVEMLAAALGL